MFWVHVSKTSSAILYSLFWELLPVQRSWWRIVKRKCSGLVDLSNIYFTIPLLTFESTFRKLKLSSYWNLFKILLLLPPITSVYSHCIMGTSVLNYSLYPYCQHKVYNKMKWSILPLSFGGSMYAHYWYLWPYGLIILFCRFRQNKKINFLS